MWYVIPFIVLLVIALVLKRREAQKEQTAPAKKTAPKQAAKKASKKAESSSVKSSVAAKDPVAANTQQSLPVADDIQQHIGAFIQSGDYATAEAQINQALNRDHRQHALYLNLLDVYILQKDDFAIEHLIKRLRSMQLHDICTLVESKQQDYQQSKATSVIAPTHAPSFAPEPVSNTTETEQPISLQNDEFEKHFNYHKKNNVSFEDVQAELKNNANNAQVASDPVQQTANFDLSLELNTDTPALTDHTADLHQPKTQAPHAGAALEWELLPLDAQVTSIPSTKVESVAQHPVPHEQTDSEKSASSARVEAPAQLAPLEFSLDNSPKKDPEPVISPPRLDLEQDDLPEFDFHYEKSDKTESGLEKNSALSQEAFSLDVEDDSFVTPAPVSHLDIATSDPLVASFPELLDLDEIQLDLDLATQYISLGAYDSARVLLNKNQAKFNFEQTEHAKKLLNQIAS